MADNGEVYGPPKPEQSLAELLAEIEALKKSVGGIPQKKEPKKKKPKLIKPPAEEPRKGLMNRAQRRQLEQLERENY